MIEQVRKLIDSGFAGWGDFPELQALVVLLFSFVVAWLVDNVMLSLVRRWTRNTKTSLDDRLIAISHRPIYITIFLVGVAIAISIIKLPGRLELTVFAIIQTMAILIWADFIHRFTRILLREFAQDKKRIALVRPQTLPLFENITFVAVLVFAVYYIFLAWDVDMSAWLASAGVLGIAVGFAAKDTLANLFSGVFIMADAPYKINDFVVLDSGERGKVTHIGIRSTRLLTRDDVEVTIPNSVMGNTKIINESGGPYEKYRVRVQAGVAYGSDLEQVRTILLAAAGVEDLVCADPAPRVRFRTMGASSLDFELLCWVEKPVQRGQVVDALNTEIYLAFTRQGVEIPYSKQDVYIKEMPSASKGGDNGSD